MHQCLLIAEIFSIITDFSSARGRKTEVYRLALTCKALSEPALDAVWREIDGLRNLVCLLPVDLWHSDGDLATSVSPSRMTRETVQSDWTRFIVHARRVTTLTLAPGSSKLPWNEPSDVRHIHQQCPEPYMLPNLVTLDWSFTAENIHVFICPTLKNLRLTSSTAVPGILELIDSNSPIITSLELNRWTRTTHIADAVVDAISLATTRMDRLVRFSCHFSIRPRALAHLSTLPMLKFLAIPLNSLDDPSFLSPTSTTLFPNLNHLIVRPSQPAILCSFLNAISSKCLDTIWWETSDTDPNSILNVVTILAQHRSRNALEHVCISAPWELTPDNVPEALITLHTINLLLTQTNITDLDLSGIWWLDLGNEDLEQIALNLPRLTMLHLGTRFGLIVHPRITLRGLIPLFQHCALEFLGVVVDAGDTVPDSEFSLTPRPVLNRRNGRSLRFLDFGNARIATAKIEATANFLAELFPCLMTLAAWKVNAETAVPDPIPEPLSSNLLWKRVADAYGTLTLHEQPEDEDDWYRWHGFNQVRP
ncbi:hypothetical protein DFH09DRAFT_1359986 [Mycena vulgaris]|nr:hypothetical protein DFH09DRAFT_1359986 [Mycena vulgaris]